MEIKVSQGISFSFPGGEHSGEGKEATEVALLEGASAMDLLKSPLLLQAQVNGTPQQFSRMTAGRSSGQAWAGWDQLLGPKWLRKGRFTRMRKLQERAQQST